MTSRVLGFLRDILIARFFGIGIAAEAFVMAFTLPNSLRHLAAEGACDTALVPVLTEERENGAGDFWRVTNTLFNVFLFSLLAITVVGVLASPFLVRLIAPGFLEDAYKFRLTVSLLRMFFPYIFLVGLSAFCMAVLHTYGRFTAPAFSSALLNLCIIGGLLVFSTDIAYLGYAVLVGGLVQLSVQFLPVLKLGPFFDIRAGTRHPAVKKVGRLLLPRAVGAGIYQINIIADRIIASLPVAGQGAVVALYYGNRLFQLPLALFGISIATVALPTLSGHAVSRDVKNFKRLVAFSLKNMVFFTVPAAAGLMVLSRPIIKILFERGEFTPYATGITSPVLVFYATGLLAYGGIKILVAAFHSMQNTVTPVRTALLALACNIVLNIALVGPLKAGGLALATSLSGFVNMTVLYIALRRRIGPFGDRHLAVFFLKVLSASAVMSVTAYLLIRNTVRSSGLEACLNLAFIIAVSLAAYILCSVLFGAFDIRRIGSWMKRS